MLTAFQCEIVAYAGDYGIVCEDCAAATRHAYVADGISRYALDEYQAEIASEMHYCAVSEDSEQLDPENVCGCCPAVYCDECTTELLEEYVDDYMHNDKY